MSSLWLRRAAVTTATSGARRSCRTRSLLPRAPWPLRVSGGGLSRQQSAPSRFPARRWPVVAMRVGASRGSSAPRRSCDRRAAPRRRLRWRPAVTPGRVADHVQTAQEKRYDGASIDRRLRPPRRLLWREGTPRGALQTGAARGLRGADGGRRRRPANRRRPRTTSCGRQAAERVVRVQPEVLAAGAARTRRGTRRGRSCRSSRGSRSRTAARPCSRRGTPSPRRPRRTARCRSRRGGAGVAVRVPGVDARDVVVLGAAGRGTPWRRPGPGCRRGAAAS
jgi:hypothetical protein